jgi:hypothetical protein
MQQMATSKHSKRRPVRAQKLVTQGADRNGTRHGIRSLAEIEADIGRVQQLNRELAPAIVRFGATISALGKERDAHPDTLKKAESDARMESARQLIDEIFRAVDTAADAIWVAQTALNAQGADVDGAVAQVLFAAGWRPLDETREQFDQLRKALGIVIEGEQTAENDAP